MLNQERLGKTGMNFIPKHIHMLQKLLTLELTLGSEWFPHLLDIMEDTNLQEVHYLSVY